MRFGRWRGGEKEEGVSRELVGGAVGARGVGVIVGGLRECGEEERAVDSGGWEGGGYPSG